MVILNSIIKKILDYGSIVYFKINKIIPLDKISNKILLFVGKIHWSAEKVITEDHLKHINNLLVKDYYIILTRRTNHLSSYFVAIADLYLTGKWSYWSHALMNLEDELKSVDDFRIIEATGKGVQCSPFNEVFDVQSVVLLKPKSMSITHWTNVLDRAKDQLGKPYDTLFNIKDSKELSCVELIRYVLQAEPNYEKDFSNFEKLIEKSKNLSPQMIYDCGDFEEVFKVEV